MKKLLSLVLCLAMVLSLAACGGGNNDKTTTAAPQPGGETTAAKDWGIKTQVTSTDKVTIRLAYDVHLYKHYCLEISCGVKNVLDQFQKDLDKGPYRDAGYIYGPSIPRTYFAGLALKL